MDKGIRLTIQEEMSIKKIGKAMVGWEINIDMDKLQCKDKIEKVHEIAIGILESGQFKIIEDNYLDSEFFIKCKSPMNFLKNSWAIPIEINAYLSSDIVHMDIRNLSPQNSSWSRAVYSKLLSDFKGSPLSFFEENLENSSLNPPHLRTAESMYQYCLDNNFGSGTNQDWAEKHFSLIENSLGKDEEVLMCFIGLHNYQSMTKHDNNYAYAITNKRMIMAQKKVIGEAIQTVTISNLNDVTMVTGLVVGTITIDTIKEIFNVAVNKTVAKSINDKIHDLLLELHSKGTDHSNGSSSAKTYSVADELLKYKELMDMGVLTQEEFDEKKKELLSQ